MLKDLEYNQADELSRYLDSLNDSKRPVVQDGEVNELIEVAVLVKQSFSQEDLPKLLIDEMVEELAAELKTQKQKRRNHWLFGGLVGTAAVLMAAFGHFLLPPSPDSHMVQQVDDSTEKQKLVAAIEQSSDSTIVESNTRIPQQNQSGNNTGTTMSVPVKDKSSDSVSQVIAEIIHGVESPEIENKPNQVAILQQETPKDMTIEKSVQMAETRTKSLRANKSIQPERKIAMMMVMPNQEAKSIKIDNTSGIIQQVYNLGNHDEIIITQRPLEENRERSKDDANKEEVHALAEDVGLQPFAKNTKGSINIITVKMDQYDITIEGNKTPTELQKIAEALIVKEVEQ
ncbi:MAG: hypothetical protein K0R78_581 [Pelosinus sp.]|jgi:hypothetical protein|nr:hypothetical protein [Pelosinus sp.]